MLLLLLVHLKSKTGPDGLGKGEPWCRLGLGGKSGSIEENRVRKGFLPCFTWGLLRGIVPCTVFDVYFHRQFKKNKRSLELCFFSSFSAEISDQFFGNMGGNVNFASRKQSERSFLDILTIAAVYCARSGGVFCPLCGA